VFGWTKTAAGCRKTHHRGLARDSWTFTLTATAYNLIRLPKLVRAVAQPCPAICPNSTQTTKIGVATDISHGFPTT
jgi:hypothetical protein